MRQSSFCNNITAEEKFTLLDLMKQGKEKQQPNNQLLNEPGSFKSQLYEQYSNNMTAISGFTPGSNMTNVNSARQTLDVINAKHKSELSGSGPQSLENLESPVGKLFSDLWNGHPISLPSHSWALHRIQKTGIGPLVVINEMMANDQGVPFPLKQLVINSSDSMMAIVLNQVFDVSLLSVLPLNTVEALQEALKYFDQIDCEYVYVEPTSV